MMGLRRVWRRWLLLRLLLLLLLLLLWRTLEWWNRHGTSSRLQRSHCGRSGCVGRAKAGETYRARLHGISSHTRLFRNDQGLGGLFERGAHLCGLRGLVLQST